MSTTYSCTVSLATRELVLQTNAGVDQLQLSTSSTRASKKKFDQAKLEEVDADNHKAQRCIV